MRYLKGLVAVVAIALVVAACSPQEPEANFGMQLIFNNPLATAPDINWSPGGGEDWDGFHVDLIGAPMGSDASLDNNGATIVIPNPGNVDRIRVQVQIKGGTDDEPYTQPDRVEFETNTGEKVIASADVSATPGALAGYYETNFGWHYNAWIEFDDAADVSVTATVYEAGGVAANPCDQECTPRAFNAWIFRTPDAANPANAGGLFHDDVWWGNGVIAGLNGLTEATSSVPIPAAVGPRDVTVEFALSDLEDGIRTAKVMIEADGMMAMDTYTSADVAKGYLGEELLIGSLTLLQVPGNVTSVDVSFISETGLAGPPHLSGGDSFFGSGAAVTADEPDGGGEGCTPGYWRQEHHFDSWTNYDPNTDFYDTVFGVDATLRTRGGPGSGPVPTVDNATLLGAVWAAGGGQNALARHAVAALLNANSPDVDYFYTEAEIIALVQDAYANGTFGANKNLLAAQNGDDTFCGLN